MLLIICIRLDMQTGSRVVTNVTHETSNHPVRALVVYTDIIFLVVTLTSSLTDCRDTYRENPYCEEWKSRGFCDTYKEQLETYCPKTCGFCISKYRILAADK